MDVNIIDCIPDDKPHCGNCYYWKDCGELFAHCKKKNEDCPSFAVCDSWCVKGGIWMERNKGYWFINEPEYLTCSECGFDYYTGYESTKEAQEHYNKPFGLYFCPHCGSEMTRKDGSDICLCVN